MSTTIKSASLSIFVAIAAYVLTACAPQAAAPAPSPQPTATAGPLSIPNLPGLPQPQTQRAATPPALPTRAGGLQSPADLLKDPSFSPSEQRRAGLDIVGIWFGQQQTDYGTLYLQYILERTGTYSAQASWRDLLTYEVGTYVLGEGFIHFMIDNYEPKIYKGVWMSRPLSWTAWYTIVDENTMEWEDRIVKSRWTVYRQ